MELHEKICTIAGKDILHNQIVLMKNQDILCKRVTEHVGGMIEAMRADVDVILNSLGIPAKAEREAPGAEEIWDGKTKLEKTVSKVNSRLKSIITNQKLLNDKLNELIGVLESKYGR